MDRILYAIHKYLKEKILSCLMQLNFFCDLIRLKTEISGTASHINRVIENGNPPTKSNITKAPLNVTNIFIPLI